jgi:hypothetical protein
LQDLDEFAEPDLLAGWIEHRKKSQKNSFIFKRHQLKYYAGAMILSGTMFFLWNKIDHVHSFLDKILIIVGR